MARKTIDLGKAGTFNISPTQQMLLKLRAPFTPQFDELSAAKALHDKKLIKPFGKASTHVKKNGKIVYSQNGWEKTALGKRLVKKL